MFDSRSQLLAGGGESTVEAALRRLLADLVLELDGPPHRDQVLGADDHEGADGDGAVHARSQRIDRLVTEGAEQLRRAREAHREEARAAARRARALAAFARSRPSSFDRPDTEVGAAAAATRAARAAALASVSEWAVDEVMVALSLNSTAATTLLVDSLKLVDRLPLTLEALEAGQISWAHAQVMTDVVARLSDDLRPVAEARLLARVDGKTHNQLRVAARRLVMRLDADALVKRLAEAIRDRRVVVYPGDDGMATLSAVLPAPVARAVQDALRQYAEAAATEGDDRTRAQRMVDCLVDLVLRPGEHGMAPVQARLTLVAAVETLLGSDEPGEVDGDVVPAEMVRQLAYALGLLPRPGCVEPDAEDSLVDELAAEEPAVEEPVSEEPVAEEPGVEEPGVDEPGVEEPGAKEPVPEVRGRADAETIQALGALLRSRSLTGSALGHRPHVALVDEISGQLVALTDAVGLRRGRGLGPPPESPGYRPQAELDRFVRLRDRRCRFPGCRARPIRCDLDHEVPWPWGRTTHDNLCCLCRHHHRLSHQAPGWRLRGLADGGLEWTTPGGIVATTHPPRFGADDDLAREQDAPVEGRVGAPPGRDGPPVVDGGPDDPPF